MPQGNSLSIIMNFIPCLVTFFFLNSIYDVISGQMQQGQIMPQGQQLQMSYVNKDCLM